MTHAHPRFREATVHDIDALLGLMSVYYDEDGYRFSERDAREQLNRFLGDPELGSLWIIEGDGEVQSRFQLVDFEADRVGVETFEVPLRH